MNSCCTIRTGSLARYFAFENANTVILLNDDCKVKTVKELYYQCNLIGVAVLIRWLLDTITGQIFTNTRVKLMLRRVLAGSLEYRRIDKMQQL